VPCETEWQQRAADPAFRLLGEPRGGDARAPPTKPGHKPSALRAGAGAAGSGGGVAKAAAAPAGSAATGKGLPGAALWHAAAARARGAWAKLRATAAAPPPRRPPPRPSPRRPPANPQASATLPPRPYTPCAGRTISTTDLLGAAGPLAADPRMAGVVLPRAPGWLPASYLDPEEQLRLQREQQEEAARPASRWRWARRRAERVARRRYERAADLGEWLD
jgi:hypothetical protein